MTTPDWIQKRLDDPVFMEKWHRFIMVAAPVIGAATITTTFFRDGVLPAVLLVITLALLLAWAFRYKDLPKREKR